MESHKSAPPAGTIHILITTPRLDVYFFFFSTNAGCGQPECTVRGREGCKVYIARLSTVYRACGAENSRWEADVGSGVVWGLYMD